MLRLLCKVTHILSTFENSSITTNCVADSARYGDIREKKKKKDIKRRKEKVDHRNSTCNILISFTGTSVL